jgi:hypothetical protein
MHQYEVIAQAKSYFIVLVNWLFPNIIFSDNNSTDRKSDDYIASTYTNW